MRRSKKFPVLLLVALLGLGACGDDNEVGKGINTNDLEGEGGLSLGATTTTVAAETTVPPPTTSAPAGAVVTTTTTTTTKAAAATTTTRPATTTTAQSTAPALVIAIQSDKASSQFDPRVGRIRVGSTVRWENRDTVARSIEADDLSFKSELIPPGGSYEYKATAAGNVNYHDGTRPYAVGSLEVV